MAEYRDDRADQRGDDHESGDQHDHDSDPGRDQGGKHRSDHGDDHHDDDFRDHPVRSYVMTAGRAHPTRNTIRPETLMVVDTDLPPPVSTSRQQQALLDMCRGVLSLAEAAAHLRLPVSLVVVIASDLVDSGHLTIRSAIPSFERPDRDLLKKVLNGLRKL